MAEKPPSTDKSTPFTKLESSEARNSATAAISSGRPIFPRGIRDSNIRFASSVRTWSGIGVEIGRGAAHAGHVPTNQPDGLVERVLPSARDEDIGAFFNEPPGARQRHAARSTRDDCNLTLKLSHNLSFQAPSLVVRGGS